MTDPVKVEQGSYCTRCRKQITIEQWLAFIENDYLCDECSAMPDSEHARSVVEGERQSRLPPV